MLRTLIAGIFGVVAVATPIDKDPDFHAFQAFLEKYDRQYADEVETLGRFQAFKQNLRLIKARSKGHEKHGINKFSDLTPDEFKTKYTGLKPTTLTLSNNQMKVVDHGVSSSIQVASIDWRTKGAITAVKNQGQCGSCWAFSATEQLETDYFLAYGKLQELSPQQITSCTTSCGGCQGGNPINGWAYISTYGGQDSKNSYPYTSGTTGATGSCKATDTSREEDVGADLGYYISQSPSQEPNMLKQIETSPMSITVDATLWQTYTGGVITSSSGCGTSIDHAVQVVGYNAEGNYWIVRNSWGTTWGENGYVYVQQGSNVCGITSQAAITIAAKVAASTVQETKPQPDPTDITEDPDFPAFMDFAQKFGKNYATEVETTGRFIAFKKNLGLVKARNAKGNEKHGVNKFTDLTADEFNKQFKGLQSTDLTLSSRMRLTDHGVSTNTAASIDWRAKGAVTAVKNQGQCGSCWAFSATQQLETDYFLAYGKLEELSPQQVTSCTTTCGGCQGGNPINGWSYVNSYGGQDSKNSYPYVSGATGATGTCTATGANREEDVGADLGYYISQSPSQEPNMLMQIAKSPMSITVDATLWQTYTGGVITSTSGCGTSIDHAVQVVGYNAPGNYWIVRNSWGTTWGEAGYVYVQQGANVCGITSQAAITIAAPVASTITV